MWGQAQGDRKGLPSLWLGAADGQYRGSYRARYAPSCPWGTLFRRQRRDTKADVDTLECLQQRSLPLAAWSRPVWAVLAKWTRAEGGSFIFEMESSHEEPVGGGRR